MNVLVVTSYPPDRNKSPECEKAFHLCENLANRGITVHVATEQGAVPGRGPNVLVHPVMKEWSWAEVPLLEGLLHTWQPDAVLLVFLSHNFNHHPMVTFLPTITREVLPNAAFVTLFEDADVPVVPAENGAVLDEFQRRAGLPEGHHPYGVLLRDSDRVVVVSERIASLLSPHGEFRGKYEVIPNPPVIDISDRDEGRTRAAAREMLRVEDRHFLLCYFGYIFPPKGIETLLRAVARVREQREDVKLLLIGGTTVILADRPFYVREMVKLADRLGLEDHVLWTGGFAWDSDEPSSLMRAADACVLPFVDGVCVHNCSFAAAVAHELPVITTRGAKLEEQFVDGENVLLCPPEDPERLAAAILRVVHDPQLYGRLQAGACRLARDYFSWDRAVDHLLTWLCCRMK